MIKEQLSADGYAIVENIYTKQEISNIIYKINASKSIKEATNLLAIRQFLKQLPAVTKLIFNKKLLAILQSNFDDEYFLVKSIYFDKPPASNWFVAYHQDLTISVDSKKVLEGFSHWTVKENWFAVQPPAKILVDNFTLRIHLDDTDEANGALHVINGSHNKGVYRLVDAAPEQEVTTCCVKAGGLMFMKPLLFHSSSRTTGCNRRRVIHLEFSKSKLPQGLEWAEYKPFLLARSTSKKLNKKQVL